MLSSRPGTAVIALERLFWVTGHDRIRMRDARVLWWSAPPESRL